MATEERRRARPRLRPAWMVRRREDVAEVIALIDRWVGAERARLARLQRALTEEGRS